MTKCGCTRTHVACNTSCSTCSTASAHQATHTYLRTYVRHVHTYVGAAYCDQAVHCAAIIDPCLRARPSWLSLCFHCYVHTYCTLQLSAPDLARQHTKQFDQDSLRTCVLNNWLHRGSTAVCHRPRIQHTKQFDQDPLRTYSIIGYTGAVRTYRRVSQATESGQV